MPTPDVIVAKVGGSLYDLPDLAQRLQTWLRRWRDRSVVLVPGGGAAADVVRARDRIHHLGEEAAHWLALRALTLNAHWLAHLLPGSRVIAGAEGVPREPGSWVILDAFAFCQADETSAGRLPHSWDVTSDSLAVRVADVLGARRLVLLKSVGMPHGMTWAAAQAAGIVDGYFEKAVRRATGLEVEVINLR